MRAVITSLVFLTSAFAISGILVGQEPKPGDKKDTKVDPKAPLVKAKGQLPQNWKDLGLTEDQKQKVYTIQQKHGDEIDKLEAQIKSIKETIKKERFEVLTPEQKKKLEEIFKGKAGG